MADEAARVHRGARKCGGAPVLARAQQRNPLRIGTVAGNAKSAPQWVAFEQRMTELGYQEGKNLIFEFIQVANVDDYALGYRELVTRKVDVLVAIGPEIALKSALAATDTLPVVMAAIDYDQLSRHYVTSLARPSGNVTGVIFQQIELAAKRIQLIREAFPSLPAATMFWDGPSADQWHAAQNAAAKPGGPADMRRIMTFLPDAEAWSSQLPYPQSPTFAVSVQSSLCVGPTPPLTAERFLRLLAFGVTGRTSCLLILLHS